MFRVAFYPRPKPTTTNEKVDTEETGQAPPVPMGVAYDECHVSGKDRLQAPLGMLLERPRGYGCDSTNVGGLRVNPGTRIKLAGLLLVVPICYAPEAAVAQPGPARREIVRAGPATLQVTVSGKGEPIVFIPSRGRSIDDFDNLSKRLVESGYQVILPQPRGIGGSTGPLEGITYHDLASDVAATIQSLVGRAATVIGHDFGGRIARTLASDHPRLVKQLVLLGVAGMVPRSPEVERLTKRFWETALSREDRLAAIRQTFFATGNDARVWEEGWYFDVARAQRASDARTPLKEWLAGGSAPILILEGAEDIIAVPENGKRLAAEFPDRVTLIEISKAAHALLPEQPEQVAKAVLAYLRR
jgi:pimeloyl-ACP methyl ester carboxylesterase